MKDKDQWYARHVSPLTPHLRNLFLPPPSPSNCCHDHLKFVQSCNTQQLELLSPASARHAMDIDKMFKLPSLPAGKGSKRKLPNLPSAGTSCPPYIPHAADVLKRFKPNTEDQGSILDARAARVEDEQDEASRFDSILSEGPPDEQDADEHEDDDEDGRFFGGGLNEEQAVSQLATHRLTSKQIMDIFDQADDGEGEVCYRP